MISSRAILGLSVCLVAGAQTQTAPAPAKPVAPKPYVNSFPVSSSPAAHGVTVSNQDASGLRLLPSAKPSNAPKPATSAIPKPAAVAKPASPKPTTSQLLDRIQAPVITPTHAPVTATAPRSASPVPKPQGSTTTVSKPPTPAVPAPKPQTAAAPASPAAAAGPFNRSVIVLDASHGGVDTGSRITDSLAEKDVTLSFAFKLRSLLQARGFTVVLTRDTDAANEPNNPGTPLTLDDRAGIANHAHAGACLLLHATASGTGVHLYRSELPPASVEATNPSWLTAQAPWVNASSGLENSLSEALDRSHIPHVASAASVRPVDSLACPALVVELAPQDASDAATANDSGYQSKVAEAMAGAFVFWRNQAQPPARAVLPPTTAAAGATQ